MNLHELQTKALALSVEDRSQLINALLRSIKPDEQSEIIDDFPTWDSGDPGFIELMRGFREERELKADNPAYTVDW
jgi:hypothetical protein